jgi:protein-disulfide isomerase
VRGSADAPVTIVEFSDFQCGFCARATQTMARVMAVYAGKVRWVLKHYPLDFHREAPLAHRAALAAGAQGRFWEMHDALFSEQRSLARADLVARAATLGLDKAKFTADLDDPRFQPILHRDKAEGEGVGVDGTPTFFINGERVVGAAPYETFAAAIDRAYIAAIAGTPDDLDLAMSRGPLDAPVTIRWFADLSSGLHRDALALLRRVVDAHGTDIRLQFFHLPSRERASGALLHEAAVAGALQGRFWELHDVLMNRGEGATQESLASFAYRLGLNREAFVDTLTSGRASQTLQRHREAALKLDVRGTPTFFVNDTRIDGVVPFDEVDKAVATELARVKPRAQ